MSSIFAFERPCWTRFSGVFCLFVLCLAGCRAELDQGQEGVGETLYLETHRIPGLDPAKATAVSSSIAIANIYEALLEYDYLQRPYVLKPCLAEALPAVSDDGLTYTFTIRKGIYFQKDPAFGPNDGPRRELVASDFVYSFKRVANATLGSPGYWIFRGRIRGLDEYRDQSVAEGESFNPDRDVVGFQAPDDRTLVISLKEP